LFTEYPKEELCSDAFKDRYGTIIEEIEEGKYSKRIFYPVYLIIRIIYVLILVTLLDYPILQLILSILFVLFPVILY